MLTGFKGWGFCKFFWILPNSFPDFAQINFKMFSFLPTFQVLLNFPVFLKIFGKSFMIL